jgi:hypothetical protein
MGTANPLLAEPLLAAHRRGGNGGNGGGSGGDRGTTYVFPAGEASLAGESLVSNASAQCEEGAFGGAQLSQYQYGHSSPELGAAYASDQLRAGDSDSDLGSSFGGLHSPRSSDVPGDVAASLVLTGRGQGRSSWTEAVYQAPKTSAAASAAPTPLE